MDTSILSSVKAEVDDILSIPFRGNHATLTLVFFDKINASDLKGGFFISVGIMVFHECMRIL
jgi:hypothetical protein